MNLIKINGHTYDGDKLTFKDFQSLVGAAASAEKFEQLTGRKVSPEEISGASPEEISGASPEISKETVKIPEKETPESDEKNADVEVPEKPSTVKPNKKGKSGK